MSAPTPDERDQAALRRMLDHAPDHASRPDARLREAIRMAALSAVQPSRVEVRDAGWSHRLKSWLGIERQTGSRPPWQAAFATIALAVLVTVMWQHEPTPGPRLDGAMEAPLPTPTPTPTPAAPDSLPAPPPPPSPAPSAPPRVEAPAARASKPEAERSTAATANARRPSAAADSAPAPATEKLREERARAEAQTHAKSAPPAAEMAAPAPPAAPAPSAAPHTSASPSTADEAGASTQATPSRRAAAPAAPRPAIAARPAFAALDAWTGLTLARPDGRSRHLTRDEAGALAALVNSVARSAADAGPSDGSAEWRITFEREGEPLAVLELSGDTARWREGNGAVHTGRPPAPLMDALRSALAQRLTGG